MRATFFVTCLVDLIEPDVGAAAVKVLRASGCQVSVPGGQTCCGQPAWNSGFAEEAARVARTSLDALEADGGDVVVVPAGSCATMIRVFWPELFEVVGDHDAAERARSLAARTKEFGEFVAGRDLPPLRLAEPTVVGYHHSCHMLRELHIEDAPVGLLDAVEGCTRATWDADQRCCGFGGLFSMKLPETSVTMADHKLQSYGAATPAAEVLVGSDSSCLMHLRTRSEHEGAPVRTQHLAQLLADALPEDDR